MSRITIADVAREAGVSMMTVSRAINNKEGIGDATRQRVLDIIERMGYRPNTIARGLVTKHTGTLGLVVPDNANPFFSEIARGVEHAAYAEGYNVFLCNTEEDKDRELDVIQSLSEKLVDGIIVCSSRLEDDTLQEALSFYSATVLINRLLDHTITLRIDDIRGGQIATQHLLNGGHRVIGLIAGPKNSFSGRQRTIGYKMAMQAAGVSCDADCIEHCLPMVDAGKDAAHTLLTRNPQMTALFCYNDLVAVGALKACAERGYAVPERVAIVGFDDIFLSSLVTPPLTTCRVARYDLGRQAAHMVLAQIEGQHERSDVLVQPELIIRASAP